MTEGTMLWARQINHGQSEIWLESDGREVTLRRTLASNEVVNVTRRHCTPDVFTSFYKDYHCEIGQAAMLFVPNLDEIAAEWGLARND
jgi:hypothetical protein